MHQHYAMKEGVGHTETICEIKIKQIKRIKRKNIKILAWERIPSVMTLQVVPLHVFFFACIWHSLWLICVFSSPPNASVSELTQKLVFALRPSIPVSAFEPQCFSCKHGDFSSLPELLEMRPIVGDVLFQGLRMVGILDAQRAYNSITWLHPPTLCREQTCSTHILSCLASWCHEGSRSFYFPILISYCSFGLLLLHEK